MLTIKRPVSSDDVMIPERRTPKEEVVLNMLRPSAVLIGRLSGAPDADQALAALADLTVRERDTLSGWWYACHSVAQEQAFRRDYEITIDMPEHVSD